jgi:hypothetical protein
LRYRLAGIEQQLHAADGEQAAAEGGERLEERALQRLGAHAARLELDLALRALRVGEVGFSCAQVSRRWYRSNIGFVACL